MIDLSHACIFSGATTELNTMVVVVDGREYKVAVAAEYEEEASIGTLKRLVKEKAQELLDNQAKRLQEIEELHRRAAELGLTIVSAESHSGLVIAKPNEPPRLDIPQLPRPVVKEPDPTPRSLQPQQSNGSLLVQKNNRIRNKPVTGLSPEEAENALEEASKRAQIDARNQMLSDPPAGAASRYAPIPIPSRVSAKVGGKEVVVDKTIVEAQVQTSQVVKGRGGIPVRLPRSEVSRAGQTQISIVNTGGDKTIQDVAKVLSAGVKPMDCGYCRGTGFIKNQDCGKCGGTGVTIDIADDY